VDGYAGAQYNGFGDLLHFYTEMSAVDPNNPFKKHFAIPHLILHAFDDPISTWRNNAASDPTSPLYPSTLVNKVQENLVLLLTKTGGHVGWPISWWPHSWKYMNDYVAAGFIDSYETSKGRLPGTETKEASFKTGICKPCYHAQNWRFFASADRLSTVVDA
jgi:predicted alpha/beta-fold hydrolase